MTIIVVMILFRRTNMEHWLVTKARLNPNQIAIESEQQSLTFKALMQLAQQKGTALKALKQKRLGLYIDNSVESLILIHAAWLYNIEIALINNRLTQIEIMTQMKSIQVNTIVTTQNLKISDAFDVIHYDCLQSNELAPIEMMHSEQQVASIMFTSGTTGIQKAVPQTFENHRASARECQNSLGFNDRTKWLLVLPLYHISGLSIVLRSLLAGFTIYLMPKFDSTLVLDVIQTQKISHVSLVPITLKKLIESGLHQPYHLEKILLGGAKLSSEFIQLGLSYHLPIYNSFGMTETCSQFLTATPEMLKTHHDTVGKATENISLKVINVNDKGHGELCVKGKNIMNGYIYPNDANSSVFDQEGYFHTGDIASINEWGYVKIYDRRKDLIISGGENIYPNEVENVAKMHPQVIDAMCVGINDETWGQRPMLYLVANQTDFNIEDYLSRFLAKYKLPTKIKFVKALPYTSTGKLKRKILSGDEL